MHSTMFPPAIQKLAAQFIAFPGIGPRQATRFALYLAKHPDASVALQKTLAEVEKEAGLCADCFLPYEKGTARAGQCFICINPQRSGDMLCVTEKETDALRLEQAGTYRGKYFVLGGTLTPLRQDMQVKERIEVLKRRLAFAPPQELILALNPTREGTFTGLYIEEMLKNLPAALRITRLGRGLTTGAEIEYIDEETLQSALEGRK